LPEPPVRARRVAAKPRSGGDFGDEWNRLVEAARLRLVTINKRRMEVAALAMEACDIVHGGGNHWKGFSGVPTLTKFAEEIGISYKTLHTWVQVKRGIVDKLDADEYDERNYNAAHSTLNRLPSPKAGNPVATVRKIYESEKTRKADRHHAAEAIRNLKATYAKFTSGKLKLKEVEPEEAETIAKLADKILKVCKAQGFTAA
jgi:DNA-binding transcriptional MerR regulator